MSKLKCSSISEDFPLYHNSLIPTIKKPKEKPKGKKILYVNTYTNEHPDFLKLDYMKEKGYRNPYLNEVIKVDRSEAFKKLENIKQRLGIINYLKRNRKYSQDPSKLKYIQTEFDVEMTKKRKKIHEINKNNLELNNLNNKYITIDSNDTNYSNILQKLNFFNPKAHFQGIKYRVHGSHIPTHGEKIFIPEENRDKLEKIKSEFELEKSSYLSNLNDYKISEANQRDKNREFNFKRNDYMKTNIITGYNEKIKLPEEKNERWGKFHENYFLMMNKSSGFRKKGGLFTEFSNKNFGSINVNKNNIKKKFIKEKEKRHYSYFKTNKNIANINTIINNTLK